MTPQELTVSALTYVTQGLGRLDQLERLLVLPSDQVGTWVSLRRNLESAQADLQAATKGA